MEEDDDLVPEPDSKGALNLSNRAWINLDPFVWTLSLKLIKLDLSYNHITEIPYQIGEMIMLRELIGSFNKITTIPKEIGRLKRLKKLYLNSNKIKRVPDELGQLENLEELMLNENSLEELPSSVEKMINLKILKLCNNRLRTVPYALADLLTLEVLDCANNPNLDIVPAAWRGDTESVLFVCRVHNEYAAQMGELYKVNKELAKHSQLMEQESITLKERSAELLAEIDDLNLHMPLKIKKQLDLKKKEMDDIDLDEPKKSLLSECTVS